MLPLLIITKPYISVSISNKKNTVYTNFVYLNYGN